MINPDLTLQENRAIAEAEGVSRASQQGRRVRIQVGARLNQKRTERLFFLTLENIICAVVCSKKGHASTTSSSIHLP